jgi:Fic family protein
LKYSEKDDWHRGNYKQHTNAVEAKSPDGSTQIIFRTTEPGFATDDAMRNLIFWYEREKIVHPLISVAAFVYDFLSIHPFQDGNGRLSRLLTTLLLMKKGYQWIQYVSLEHEIENRKKEYYKNLRICQAQRPNEDITEWIMFFFEALTNVQEKLSRKLELKGVKAQLSPKEKTVYLFIGQNSGAKIGQMITKLDISRASMKTILKELLAKNIIEKHGNGAGTNYTIR